MIPTARARLPLLGAALLAVALAACGGGASPIPSPTPAPGATPAAATSAPSATSGPAASVLTADAVGLAMPLAAGWVLLPVDAPAKEVLALLPEGSQLAGSLANGMEPLVEAGLAGWAIDGTAGPGGVTPNVNVIVRPGVDVPDLDALTTAVGDELAAVPGISDVSVGPTELSVGPAVRATYLALGQGEDAAAEGHQYTIPIGDDLVIVSFTIPRGDPAGVADVQAMVADLAIGR